MPDHKSRSTTSTNIIGEKKNGTFARFTGEAELLLAPVRRIKRNVRRYLVSGLTLRRGRQNVNENGVGVAACPDLLHLHPIDNGLFRTFGSAVVFFWVTLALLGCLLVRAVLAASPSSFPTYTR